MCTKDFVITSTEQIQLTERHESVYKFTRCPDAQFNPKTGSAFYRGRKQAEDL